MITKEQLYKALAEESCTKMFLADLVAKNGHKLIAYPQLLNPTHSYETVFNYSERHGGTFDSFKYYGNYIIDLGEKK